MKKSFSENSESFEAEFLSAYGRIGHQAATDVREHGHALVVIRIGGSAGGYGNCGRLGAQFVITAFEMAQRHVVLEENEL
jgi:hypothetical protein